MRAPPRPLIFALFVLSGAAGLVYELVWTRELILVFGGTTYAITTVLVAFMGGLGLGGYIAGRIAARLRQPGVVYGVIELLIGLYALGVPLLLDLAAPMYRSIYLTVGGALWPLTLARFAFGALVVLLPATLMGATLPLLVRQVTISSARLGESVALLYGVNALGAVLGVTATGFVLLPTLGVTTTTRIAAALNGAVGLAAILLLRMQAAPLAAGEPPGRAARRAADPRAAGPAPIDEDDRRNVLWVFAISGFAAMVYQIMWTRSLVLNIGSSTYSFTVILAAFILGISLGSLAVARFADRVANPLLAIGVIEVAIGISATAAQLLIKFAPHIVQGLIEQHSDAWGRLLTYEFLLVFGVTCVPTLLMGALFPLVTRTLARGQDDAAEATGRAYAVNTLGTILGAFCGGFVLIWLIGAQNAITLVSLMNVLAGLWIGGRALRLPKQKQMIAALVSLTCIAALVQGAGQWDQMLLSSGVFMRRGDAVERAGEYEVEYFMEGVDITVAITRPTGDEPGSADLKMLSVNGKVDASTTRMDMLTQILAGQIPSLLAPDRELNACVVGLGSGMTLSALTRHPNVRRVDCVELSEAVVQGARIFGPYNYGVLDFEPRVTMIHGDGRNHLAMTDQTYDVIVSEPSNPWIRGVASLFTREFFEIAKSRLADDGVLCVWVQGYSLSIENFRMILRTLGSVFDFVTIWEMAENDYALVVSRQPPRVPLERLRRRFEQVTVRTDLCRVGMTRLERLLGQFIGSGTQLRAWIGDGPIHTDDGAQLEFSAPRELYAEQGRHIFEALVGRVEDTVFDSGVVELAEDDPAAGWWRDQTRRVMASRLARVEAFKEENALKGPWVTGEILLSGYALDPGAEALYKDLRTYRRAILSGPPSFVNSAEAQRMVKRIDAAREPTWANVRGEPIPYFVQRLRAWAARWAEQGHWQAAYDYLVDARAVDPDDPAVTLDLAWVLDNAGARDEAVLGLREALSVGTLTPAQIAQSERMTELLQDDRVQALLAPTSNEASTSTTSTRPAPATRPAATTATSPAMPTGVSSTP